MCDYSLHGLPNRLAQEGEDLVAHRFPTGAIGLTSPAELCRMADSTKPQKKGFWSLIKSAFMPPGMPEIPAVCVPPGAKLRMLDIPANLQTFFCSFFAKDSAFRCCRWLSMSTNQSLRDCACIRNRWSEPSSASRPSASRRAGDNSLRNLCRLESSTSLPDSCCAVSFGFILRSPR